MSLVMVKYDKKEIIAPCVKRGAVDDKGDPVIIKNQISVFHSATVSLQFKY